LLEAKSLGLITVQSTCILPHPSETGAECTIIPAESLLRQIREAGGGGRQGALVLGRGEIVSSRHLRHEDAVQRPENSIDEVSDLHFPFTSAHRFAGLKRWNIDR
jgi:hypothetical protein